MTEAWMQRGVERQELLDGIKLVVYEEEELVGDRLDVEVSLATHILNHLKDWKTQGGGNISPNSKMARIFYQKIYPTIKKFARTSEEETALIADLFIWLANSIASQYKQGLQRQEIFEPEKVFDGYGAMDVV